MSSFLLSSFKNIHATGKVGESSILERFGERRTEFRTDNAPYLPFLLGHYACPEKELGNHETKDFRQQHRDEL